MSNLIEDLNNAKFKKIKEENEKLKNELSSIKFRLNLVDDQFKLLNINHQTSSFLINNILKFQISKLYNETNFNELFLNTIFIEECKNIAKKYKKLYHIHFYDIEYFIYPFDNKIIVHKFDYKNRSSFNNKIEHIFNFEKLTQDDLFYILCDSISNHN